MLSARLAFNHISPSVSLISLKSLALLYHHTFLPLFFEVDTTGGGDDRVDVDIMVMMRDGGDGDAHTDDNALSMTGCDCIKLKMVLR